MAVAIQLQRRTAPTLALAYGKHAWRGAAGATPQTGVRVTVAVIRFGLLGHCQLPPAPGASRGKKMARALRSTVRICSGGISALGSCGNPSSLMLFCSA